LKAQIRFLAVLIFLFSLAIESQGSQQEHKDKHDQHKEGSDMAAGFPELDNFHKLLHTIWHENYPKNQWSEIRAQREELVKRKDAVMKAELHVKPENKKHAEELRTKFGQAVDQLAASAKSGTDDELKKTVAEMHEAFEQFADSVG